MAERSATGNLMGPSPGVPQSGVRGMMNRRSRTSVSAAADIDIPSVSKLSTAIATLEKNLHSLKETMASFAQSGAGKKLADQFDLIDKRATAASHATGTGIRGGIGADGFGGARPNAWQSQGQTPPALMVKGVQSTGMTTTPMPTSAPAAAMAAPRGSTTGAGAGDLAGGRTTGTGLANTAGNFMSNITGQNGVMSMLTAPLTGVEQMWGSLAGGSMQYAYNRINGPQGNMNSMLRLSQALAPNVTMMNAAGGTGAGGKRLTMQDMITGLAQRMPIQGTQDDMISTILAGQSVGALMTGTPQRNGFFESARQMQALNPGQSPGTISGTLAGYIGNTKAQQMGAMMGEGAFTMIGQGGSYKTLAQWAHGITEFLKQHRPGGMQGKSFTKAELITQNFPGSNINSWFQMMGVPQNMVDYWWQYVLTDKGGVAADDVTSKVLQEGVTKDRGINLGYEQLRTATSSTRRDYLMGNQMYGMYAANASANRRFNVSMGATDQGLAHTLQSTNIGRMLALLPTPIMEMLMPILTQLVSSPLGAGAAAVGGLMGDPIGDPSMPIGDYGPNGGTSTSHLSPDLAGKVGAMMKANPNLKISSGYRDTVTQNRLRRGGNPNIAPASKSAHTRGWAVDIGPVSQLGWVQKNAGKFGLQTAASFGEPWHLQRAGTQMGDPQMPIGDGILGTGFGPDVGPNLNPFDALTGMAKDIADGVLSVMKDFMKMLMDQLTKPMTNFLDKFTGSGSYSSMIDEATKMFSRLMTAPLSGLAKFGGKATGGPDDLAALINQPVDITVPVVSPGFNSSGSLPTSPIFGDPMPYGDPMSPMSGTLRGSGITLIFQAPITIQGGAGGIDARRTAATLADHLEEEVNNRSWLVS